MGPATEGITLEISKCKLVVYSGSFTSAVVEAFYLDLHVISYLNPCHLNMSPLRGYTDINFVSSAEDFLLSLNLVINGNQKKRLKINNYFFLDYSLSRWHELLLKN